MFLNSFLASSQQHPKAFLRDYKIKWGVFLRTQAVLTLQTQLMLPMIPFGIDTIARGLMLHAKIPFWQIPDLVTFLATLAFFCLGLMFSVETPVLPSDDDLKANTLVARQELLGFAIVAVTLAGGISFLRAASEQFPQTKLYEEHSFSIFVIVLLMSVCGLSRVFRTHLSYVG
ncbi:MAG: hypothetical protein U1E93_13105 [Alphaproteobacteria bacterium]